MHGPPNKRFRTGNPTDGRELGSSKNHLGFSLPNIPELSTKTYLSFPQNSPRFALSTGWPIPRIFPFKALKRCTSFPKYASLQLFKLHQLFSQLTSLSQTFRAWQNQENDTPKNKIDCHFALLFLNDYPGKLILDENSVSGRKTKKETISWC